MDVRDWGRGERQGAAKMEEAICNSTRLEQPRGLESMTCTQLLEARWLTESDAVRVAISLWKGSCKSGVTPAQWTPPYLSLTSPSEHSSMEADKMGRRRTRILQPGTTKQRETGAVTLAQKVYDCKQEELKI